MQRIERERQTPGISGPLKAHVVRGSADKVPDHAGPDVPACRQALDQRRARIDDRTQLFPETSGLCDDGGSQQARKRLGKLQSIPPVLAVREVVVDPHVDGSASGGYAQRIRVHVVDEAPQRFIETVP